jgi:hypothetical protein
MPSVIILAPDGTHRRATLTGLAEYQNAVGGYIEFIGLPACDVFINEDGIARDLPANPKATRFVKRELGKAGRVLLSADGWILGPVVLVGRADAEGDPTDCPDLDLDGA